MSKVFKTFLFIILYCTPIALVYIPIAAIVTTIRAHKAVKASHYLKTGRWCRKDFPPRERNMHYGVDL